MSDLQGIITGNIISVRFAFSGKIASIRIHPGDVIKTGQILASLDRKELQTILDKELADYESTRAQFEIYVQKAGDPADDLAKFAKKREQSALDVSVKAVELAKFRLDQADLYSPVAGIITSDGGLRPGLYVTPSANPVEILETNSLVFTVPIEFSNLSNYPAGTAASVKLDLYSDPIPGTVLPFVPPADSKKPPTINFKLNTDLPLYPGLTGNLHL